MAIKIVLIPEETLERIEQLGELQFTLNEVGCIIGQELGGKEDAEEAFQRGRLNAQELVRREILNSARAGNTTAIKQFNELVENSEELD